jgi:hypothetical protein
MTRDLTFLKKTSSQVATNLLRISQDAEPDPGSTAQNHRPKHHSTRLSDHTRILGEEIISDQDWSRYLLKYPVLYFDRYFITLLFIVDIHFTFRTLSSCT